MSDTAVIDTPDTFAEKAVPLLKEYVNKVQGIKQELRKLREAFQTANVKRPDKKAGEDTERIFQAEFDALEQYFHQLQPALEEFGQQVSGMIDQGRVTPLTRSELHLRLAELESLLFQIGPLMDAYRPQ